MAFDFLDNIPKYYPANLRYIGQVVDILNNQCGNNNYIKTSLTPVRYNAFAMASPTLGTDIKDFRNMEYQFDPEINQSEIDNPNRARLVAPTFAVQNEIPSHTYGTYIKTAYEVFDELVVYFEYMTVKDWVAANANGYDVCEAMLLQGSARYKIEGTSERFVSFEGFVSPATFNDPVGSRGEFSNINFIPTHDYDDYYIITNFVIYRKQDDVAVRTTTPYRPVLNYLFSTFNLMNTYYNYKERLRLVYGCNGLAQIALTGTSIYGRNQMFYIPGNDSQPPYNFTAISNIDPSYGALLPTAILSKRILDISNATPIIDSNISSNYNQYFALNLAACPIVENSCNHIALNVVYHDADGWENDECVCFTAGDKKYAGQVKGRYNYTLLAFKSLTDIIMYFNDWGLKATSSEYEARNTPYDAIETEGTIPSPSGGDSGSITPDFPADDNTSIPSIPNIPDDTIDDFLVDIPNISPINLMTNYALNYQGVKSLFNWLCTSSYIDNISELFADKLSAIYGLIQYPFDIVSHDPVHSDPRAQLSIVNVATDLQCHAIVNGYNTIINGGQISYVSYFGDYRDWDNCKYSVYVPYAGVIDIPANCVVNRTLKLQYCVDLLTGKATAVLKSYENSDTLGALVKTIPCQVGLSLPVQASNYGQQAINNALTSISMISNIGSGLLNSITSLSPMPLINAGIGAATTAASMAFKQQTQYSASGGVSPSTGLALPQTPYLCITRARPVKPSNFAKINGLPTNVYTKFSSVAKAGNIVKMQNVIVTSGTATDAELNEIRAALERGVYT